MKLIGISVPVLTMPVLAIEGIIQRKKIGRWAGLASLVMFFVFAVTGNDFRGQGPIYRFEYSTDPRRVGEELAYLVLYILSIVCVILAFRFGFSKKSKNYFGS